MEHLEHFGLSQDPFVNDPVTRFFFASRLHTDAERRLLRCVRQGKGLGVLVGETGCGKTTLLRHLFEQLDEASFEAILMVMVHDDVDAGWLLSRLAGQLGVEEPASERRVLLGQIYERLVAIREEGRHTVVLVDEAQMLARRDIMTELRGLLNLEHEERHLLSLVVAGLPELDQALALDKPLEQRIAIKVHLDALDPESAAEYLAHRVRAAGGDPTILAPEAVALIVRTGQGVPRLMNTLADNALYEAYLEERPYVAAEDVERAARDLSLWQDEPAAAPEPAAAAAQVATAPASVARPLAPECPMPSSARASATPPIVAAAAAPPRWESATPAPQRVAPSAPMQPVPASAPVQPVAEDLPAQPESAPIFEAAPPAAPSYPAPPAAPAASGSDDVTVFTPAPAAPMFSRVSPSVAEQTVFFGDETLASLDAPPLQVPPQAAPPRALPPLPPAPPIAAPYAAPSFVMPIAPPHSAQSLHATQAILPLPPADPVFDIDLEEDPFPTDAPEITVVFDEAPGDSGFLAPPSRTGVSVSGLPPHPQQATPTVVVSTPAPNLALDAEPEVAPVFDDAALEHPDMNEFPFDGPPKDDEGIDDLFGVLDEDSL